jgi:hypothetical protein
MFDYVNRHFGVSFNELFGGPGWTPEMSESETIQLYCDRMKAAGQFNYSTYTRILNPTKDRTYFYLVYGTRHWKGLYEFRNVEKKFVDEQERIRTAAKQTLRIEKTRQQELFGATDTSIGNPSFEIEREHQLGTASNRLLNTLLSCQQIQYEDLLPSLLELPLVWESDVKEMIMSRCGRELEIVGMKPREKTVKPGHILRSLISVR